MQQNQPPQIKMLPNQAKRNQSNQIVMRNQMMPPLHQRKLLPQLSQLLNQLLKLKLQSNLNKNQMRNLMMPHPLKNQLLPQSQLLVQNQQSKLRLSKPQNQILMMKNLMMPHPPKSQLLPQNQLLNQQLRSQLNKSLMRMKILMSHHLPKNKLYQLKQLQ